MKLRIFTNHVSGGWYAEDINDFLGGSEEHMVLLSEAFSRKGYEVYVYHTYPEPVKEGEKKRPKEYEYNGVHYGDRLRAVRIDKGDILLSFKDNLPWRGGERDADIKIYFSMEVERPWDVSNVDAYVCLTKYHASRVSFVPEDKKVIIGCGIDVDSLEKNLQTPRNPNSMLYCSSPDRGLYQLLEDWPLIKKNHPEMVLNVTYGFKNLEHMAGKQGFALKNKLLIMMEQEGVNFLGQLKKDEIEKQYYRNQYWVLPLLNPDSELFCLNAVKSSYCGCIPVVNKIGALRETVFDYIPYGEFVKGDLNLTIDKRGNKQVFSWDEMVSEFWEPLFDKVRKERQEKEDNQ
jgi:hypothetical protein